MEEKDIRVCPVCEREVERSEMQVSKDCHGLRYRLLCWDCLEKIYEEKGYEGEYYTEADECLDEYY